MTQSLSDLTQSLLAAATKAGADAADALAVDGTSISIDVLDGKLEHAERAEGIDVGLRVLVGQRQACVSASDTRPDTITMMAERAVAMAREAPEDATIGLASPTQLAQDLDATVLELVDPADGPAPATLEEDALRTEAAALEINGVSKVESSSAGYGHRRIHLAASNGFSAGYARTDCGLSCVAITGSGRDMERDYATCRCQPFAIKQSRARDAQAVRVFDDRHSFGQHLLAQQVARPGCAARNRRAIVDDGVLTCWTLDLATARKLGLQSTANASRGTSAPPSPSVANIALSQGSATRADLIRDMGTGLLVTSMMGSSINPTTGDYSRGASGFWVESGQITHPVNECTIAGNLLDILKTITPANDARAHLSRVVPSLLVQGLTLAGE